MRQIVTDRIVDLLKRVAPARDRDLEDLLRRHQPVFVLETEQERILFNADFGSKTITLGNKGSCRLQAHAYAAGIFLAALATPGYLDMAASERDRLYAPANFILTWAVGRELQQWLRQGGVESELGRIMEGAEAELPEGLLPSLTRGQRIMGEGLFRFAIAFIVLHELAHMELGHTRSQGGMSLEQEKEADRFAAEWLVECPGLSDAQRLNTCLLWPSLSFGLLSSTYIWAPVRAKHIPNHMTACSRSSISRLTQNPG